MMLIFGPKPAFSAASSDSFASGVGVSPESLMSLPLRVIDTGANATGGIVGEFGAPETACARSASVRTRRPVELRSGPAQFAIADYRQQQGNND